MICSAPLVMYAEISREAKNDNTSPTVFDALKLPTALIPSVPTAVNANTPLLAKPICSRVVVSLIL